MKRTFTTLFCFLCFFLAQAQPCSKFTQSTDYVWAPQRPCNWLITFDSGVHRYDSIRLTIDTNSKNRWEIGHLNKLFFGHDSAKGNVIVTDTIARCLPNDTSSFTLMLKTNLFEGLWDFLYHYRLSLRIQDTAYVERSADSITWTTVLKISDPTDTNCHEVHESPAGYHNYPDSMFYRFTLITGPDTNARDGWMLDDFLMIQCTDVIKKITATDFNVFPNPARTAINLQFTNTLDENADMLLYNSIGTIVKKQTVAKGLYTATMDVSDLRPGVYICTVNTGNGKITRRVSIY